MDLDEADILLRLLAATAAGMALGLNRDLQNKPIGMRTLGLVSLGAAIVVVATVYFENLVGHPDGLSRVVQGVIQGIMAGISFIGAGVILRDAQTRTVEGLTTAATVWVTAALGIACGLAAGRSPPPASGSHWSCLPCSAGSNVRLASAASASASLDRSGRQGETSNGPRNIRVAKGAVASTPRRITRMAIGSARVVLLTGAAGGIGRVMTQALLADGHRVAVVDRDAGGLERLADAAQSGGVGGRLHPIVADLFTPAGCEQAVATAQQRLGPIDALINNAGIGMSSIRPDAEAHHPGIEELTPEMFGRFFAIFVTAPAVLTRAVVPSMRARGFGRIVNNTTSYLTMLRVLPYGAAKAAFEAMSAVWATELEGSGVTVNVLVPGGPTDTGLISDQSGWPREKMLRPAIMGPPTAWLVSDASAGFSGRRITAARWDVELPPAEAAAKASRAIGWPELGADAVWLTG